MTITRAAVVAAVGIVAGSAFAVCSSPIAAATPVPDGLYRLNFAGTEPSDFDYPEPRGPYTWLLAIRSACPAAGCVATATNVGGVSTTYVFRQDGGRYISSQPQGFACGGNKTAGHLHDVLHRIGYVAVRRARRVGVAVSADLAVVHRGT